MINVLPKILFTKYYPPETVAKELGDIASVNALDFIETEYIDLTLIEKQLPLNSKYYIVSSLRSAKQVLSLELKGQFLCVGEQSQKFLQEKGLNVIIEADNAEQLLDRIKEEFQFSQNIVYLCSDLRAETLPEGIRELGHDLTEIVIYSIRSKKVYIDQKFNIYVFFSPSGVKSFQEQYTIPEKATIFALGNTTAQEIELQFNRIAIIPEKPIFKLLIKKIKDFVDAEK